MTDGPATPSNPPAGWYPDPERADMQRYWDGAKWTEHHAPGASPSVPTAGAAATPPTGAPTATATQVAAAPQKKGKGCLFWGLMVLLGLVALMVVGGVMAAVGGGTGGTQGSASNNPANVGGNTNGSAGDTGSQGDVSGPPYKDGKFAFTPVGIQCGIPKVGNQYLGSKASGQYCIVRLKVKNIGNESQMFDASNQYAYSPSGQKYDADSEASLYANNSSQSFLEDINPGNSITVNVVFDIPKNSSIAELELHDSLFSGGVTFPVSYN